MAVSVTHSTPADGTFSASGQAAWDAAHTLSGLATVAETGAHSDLSGVGTNTHAQIDTHIASTSNPHSVTATQVGLGNVTNHAQTQAAIVPNTAPSAGQILAGNAGGTAYAPVSMSGDATLASTGAITVSQARGLLETTGPTTLSMGAVADGEFLKRSGTSIVGAASTGGATWNGITAATGDATTSNTTNRIVYQVAPTADSRIAWRFTESSAATSGTSTSGVPNQVLLQLDTLASSTQSPLKVLSRGSHVFSVSPTTAQILGTNGSTSAPTYSFAASTNSGLTYSGSEVYIVVGGTAHGIFSSSGVFCNTTGSATATAMGYFGGSGFSFPSATGVTLSTGTTNVRAVEWVAGSQTVYKSLNDAVGYAINARKSRNTATSPSVITTGDDLLTISGFGYVGATNTYQEACRITFDSTGTISDSATGIGGIMRFLTAKVGAEPTEIMRLVTGTTTGGGWLCMDEADANPGTSDLTADEDFALYRKADKFVIAYNSGGTMNYLVFSLDGSTTTFTNSTTAP